MRQAKHLWLSVVRQFCHGLAELRRQGSSLSHKFDSSAAENAAGESEMTS